jgi:hypothetical protein
MGDAERDGNRIIATLANATAGAAGPVEGKQHQDLEHVTFCIYMYTIFR